jgi:hypothetical protein
MGPPIFAATQKISQHLTYMHTSSPYSCDMLCPSHPLWYGHPKYTWRRVQVMKLLVVQVFQSPDTPLLFGPNILLSAPFSNTLCSIHNVREEVSYPQRTTGKISSFYSHLSSSGAWGSVVCWGTLCYSLKGSGFEIRWGHWIFSNYLIPPTALGSGVYSASSRNTEKMFLGNTARTALKADNLTAICEQIV